MWINAKLASILPVFGLAAAVISPANIDDKPRTWADFGVPDLGKAVLSLVKYNGHYSKVGENPTTEKHYKIDGFTIVEESADGRVKRVRVIRPNSGIEEVYVPKSNKEIERLY